MKNYVAFGDSVGFGYGATTSYPRRYEKYLNAYNEESYALTNLSVSGKTSSILLAELEKPGVQGFVRTANILTINIGWNDLLAAANAYNLSKCGGSDNQDCLRAAVGQFKANWTEIILLISHLIPSGGLIRACDMHDPYAWSAGTVDTWANDGVNNWQVWARYQGEANARIHESCEALGIPVARVHEAFNGPDGTGDSRAWQIADGHPNDDGSAVIAYELHKLGYF